MWRLDGGDWRRVGGIEATLTHSLLADRDVNALHKPRATRHSFEFMRLTDQESRRRSLFGHNVDILLSL